MADKIDRANAESRAFARGRSGGDLARGARQGAVAGARSRLHRRRLRRHRNESSLCAARIALARLQGRTAHARVDHRRDVASHLCADLHGYGQICAVPDARRQPRRGRHPVADGARAVRVGEARPRRVPSRRRRRGAVFRRRDHHASDLGPFGRRGSRSRHGAFQGLCELQGLRAGGLPSRSSSRCSGCKATARRKSPPSSARS